MRTLKKYLHLKCLPIACARLWNQSLVVLGFLVAGLRMCTLTMSPFSDAFSAFIITSARETLCLRNMRSARRIEFAASASGVLG